MKGQVSSFSPFHLFPLFFPSLPKKCFLSIPSVKLPPPPGFFWYLNPSLPFSSLFLPVCGSHLLSLGKAPPFCAAVSRLFLFSKVFFLQCFLPEKPHRPRHRHHFFLRYEILFPRIGITAPLFCNASPFPPTPDLSFPPLLLSKRLPAFFQGRAP